MKRIWLAALAAALLANVVPASAGPTAPSASFIRTINQTTDAWVWITAYSPRLGGHGKIEGAWCVAPGGNDEHGLHAVIVRVRAEVTKAGCAHPVMNDTILETSGPTRENGSDVWRLAAYVRGHAGSYTYSR